MQPRIRVAQGLRTRVRAMAKSTPRSTRTFVREGGRVAHVLEADAPVGDPVVVEKVCSSYTSHDLAISEPLLSAREAPHTAVLDVGVRAGASAVRAIEACGSVSLSTYVAMHSRPSSR